jgi:RND family efflux transporter MFP subunit
MFEGSEQMQMLVDQSKSTDAHRPVAPPDNTESTGVSPFVWIALLVLGAVLGFFVYRGLAARAKANVQLVQNTEQGAVPTLVVTNPQSGSLLQEIALPGNTQAFTDTPIYARTNGYLRHWYFDIGARVKAGQLLAEIETPEVDQQLQQARAELATAQANYTLSQTTAERWQFLLKSDSVSKQETDEKIGDLNAKKAIVDSFSSNVRRLEETQGFQKIYAPFSGVITARNTDIGALINAGANAPTRELFHLASINTLRVYVNVPEVYSRAAVPGASATLTLDEYPGRIFEGKLVRNANAIDVNAHTLLVEVDVDNPKGELLPGAYVSVHLKLPSQVPAFTIPSNALLFRQEGLRAVIVRDGKAELVPIKIGRDFGHSVEVLAGLSGTDPVVLNPPDSIISGTPVNVKHQDTGEPKIGEPHK